MGRPLTQTEQAELDRVEAAIKFRDKVVVGIQIVMVVLVIIWGLGVLMGYGGVFELMAGFIPVLIAFLAGRWRRAEHSANYAERSRLLAIRDKPAERMID